MRTCADNTEYFFSTLEIIFDLPIGFQINNIIALFSTVDRSLF